MYSGERSVPLGALVLVHLSRRLKCTIVIMRCPSSDRLSVVRPSVINFSHFRLLLWNHWTEFNKTFRVDRKNKMTALASDWLRHFRLLLWNHWTEFNETWQEARSQRPLPSLCFSGRSEKQDGRPDLWLAEAFSTSPLKPLNGIQRNLTGSKISMSSIKFVFFGLIGKKQDGRPGLETVERNSTKLDRKQDLNVLYQVCVFRADRKNKMAALASDWLISTSSTKFVFFGPIGKTRWPPRPLIGWNILDFFWTAERKFNETWQEARSQRPLPSLCFSGRSVNKNVRLCRVLKQVAHCFQVHELWPFGPLV